MARLTIWKTQLELIDLQTVELPAGAQILCAQTQRETLCVWYLCNPDALREPRQFSIIGTGHEVGDHNYGKHVGTVQLIGGDLVFHVFDRGRP